MGRRSAKASWNAGQWAGYILFPKYQNADPRYPGAEFGCVARRRHAGTLITGRLRIAGFIAERLHRPAPPSVPDLSPK